MPKKPLKKAIKKAVKKAAKKVAKKAPAKKVAKKAPAKKAPAKKVAAKKAPAKAVKKNPGRPFPSKTTLTVDEKSQTVSVKTIVAPQNTPVVEERRLVMPPPARPVKSGKKIAPLKPIKQAPTPIVVSESESAWNAAELKAIRSELAKELVRLQTELAAISLIISCTISGIGNESIHFTLDKIGRAHV